MLSIAVPFLTALAVSLALVPICRAAAIRLKCVAQPREDRWHRRPMALFGGVAIGLTLFGCMAVFGGARELPVLLACGGLVFIVGLTDDVISLKPSTKLVAEIALASVFLFFNYRLNWTESLTIDSLLTLVWVVGLTNAFNLLDNMDGLCAGIALIVGAALLVDLLPAAPGTDAFVEARYLAVLLGATAGFLVYNLHPASIFMGDSGSLLLGLSFAGLTLSFDKDPFSPAGHVAGSSDPLSIVAVPLLVLLIPILDTTLVTVSRKLWGRPASAGGRDHSSHRLVAIGLSERAAVALLWLLAGVSGIIGVGMDYFSQSWSGLVAVMFLIGMVIFAVYLARIRVYEDVDPALLNRGTLTPIVVNFMYKRRVAEVLLDVCLVSIAYYAAYRLRFEGGDFVRNFGTFLNSLPVVLAAQMVALFVVGVYRGVWRYFGLMDTVVIAKGVLAGAITAQLVMLYLYRFESYSRTVFAIYGVLLVLILTASRASFRLIGEFLQRRRHAGRRLVIYGAGDGGSLVVRELLRAQPIAVKILGFIDDDPRKARLRVQGYPVLGAYDSLASLVSNGVVDSVVVSARLLDVDRLHQLEALCSEHAVALSRLHVGLEQLVSAADAPPAPAHSGLRKSAP